MPLNVDPLTIDLRKLSIDAEAAWKVACDSWWSRFLSRHVIIDVAAQGTVADVSGARSLPDSEFRSRLDEAAQRFHRFPIARNVKISVLGSRLTYPDGTADAKPLSEIGHDYLMARGVPSHRILGYELVEPTERNGGPGIRNTVAAAQLLAGYVNADPRIGRVICVAGEEQEARIRLVLQRQNVLVQNRDGDVFPPNRHHQVGMEALLALRDVDPNVGEAMAEYARAVGPDRAQRPSTLER